MRERWWLTVLEFDSSRCLEIYHRMSPKADLACFR